MVLDEGSACLGQFLWCASAGRLRPARPPWPPVWPSSCVPGASSPAIACDDYYRCGWSPSSHYGFDTVDAIDADS